MQNLPVVNGTCYLCGDTSYRDVFLEDGIPLRRCQGCGHVYSGFQQAEHYDGYWDHEAVSEERLRFWDDAHRPVFSQFIAHFLPERPGTLVDVGCGLGFFVDAVRRVRPGWDVHGYELAPAAVEWSHANLGLQGAVHEGLVQDAGIEPGTVDVITMWDVLEHLTHPQPLLEHLRSLLKPEGVLFVQTPSVAFQLPKAWLTVAKDRGLVPGKDYVCAKDHVNLFSRKALDRLSHGTGFGDPEYVVLRPILAVGGRRDRRGEAAKLALYGLTRGLFAATRGRALLNPTLFAFLRPDPARQVAAATGAAVAGTAAEGAGSPVPPAPADIGRPAAPSLATT